MELRQMCLELRRHLRTVRDVSARAIRRRERNASSSASAGADSMTRSVTVAALSGGMTGANAAAAAERGGGRLGHQQHIAARAIAGRVGGAGSAFGAGAVAGAGASAMTMSMFVAPASRSDSCDAPAEESCTRPKHSAAAEDTSFAENQTQEEELQPQAQRDSASPPLAAAAFERPSTPEQLRQIELDWRLGALRGALDDLKQLLLDASIFAHSNS